MQVPHIAAYDFRDRQISMTDATGTPQNRYVYEPYGWVLPRNGNWSDSGSRGLDRWSMRHQELAFDLTTGVIYRWLHPFLGVFNRRSHWSI